MVDSEDWIYIFHLEYKQNTLQVEEGVKNSYSPVPMKFNPEYKSDESDFYGVIFNVKNKEVARFGFMAPTSVVASLGKSIMSVPAPFFADADHVTFYSRGGKMLLTISVKDSSFCNDNNKCDTSVGEDYKNCPADCPAPVNVLPPPPIEPIMTPTPEPVTPQPAITPTQPNSYATTGDASYVTTSTAPLMPVKTGIDIKTILTFIGGVLFIVIAFVFYRIQKRSQAI